MYEITEGKLGVLEPPPTTPAEPVRVKDGPSSSKLGELEEQEDQEEEEEVRSMQSRLESLRSWDVQYVCQHDIWKRPLLAIKVHELEWVRAAYKPLFVTNLARIDH